MASRYNPISWEEAARRVNPDPMSDIRLRHSADRLRAQHAANRTDELVRDRLGNDLGRIVDGYLDTPDRQWALSDRGGVSDFQNQLALHHDSRERNSAWQFHPNQHQFERGGYNHKMPQSPWASSPLLNFMDNYAARHGLWGEHTPAIGPQEKGHTIVRRDRVKGGKVK